jgi:hypothetical protein
MSGFQNRRSFIQALPGLAWLSMPVAHAKKTRGRVIVIGGGWGGLSAAASLRRLAPQLEVLVIDRDTEFFSLPLSNRWIAGTLEQAVLTRNRSIASRRHDYRLLQSEVTAIDRDRRIVIAGDARISYDWLVLACGIRHNYAGWFGENRDVIAYTKRLYSAAYSSGEEVANLKRRIESFAGGDLLMTIPPGPMRCPPAPYERAVAIAHRLRQRRIKFRITLLDAGPGILGFHELFARRFADVIHHVPHTVVKSIDPFARVVQTEFDEYRFDEAILMPPQQAGDIVWQADLISRTSGGVPTGWGEQDPLRLQAVTDERIFLVGDLIGPTSALFGHYSKTAHIAVALGGIAAAEIAARDQGRLVEPEFPEGSCYVLQDLAPPTLLHMLTRYRLRGDGEITQSVRQHQFAQPDNEDLAWLNERLNLLI